MKKCWKLLLCLGIPLAVGGLSALLSGDGMRMFTELNQPPLSPPGWLFPIVWTILYLAMGLASYLVRTSDAPVVQIRKATAVYGLQLAVNFLWSIIFFSAGLYLAAFVWHVLLWILIIITVIRFYRIQERAGDLLVPYLLWVTFAGYLNFGIYLLN